MSMISELIKNLRALADFHNVNANLSYAERKLVNEAADTIEALSAKLSAANMERSERYYNGGWIVCKDRTPDKVGTYIIHVITGTGEDYVGMWIYEQGVHLSGKQTYVDNKNGYWASPYNGDPIPEGLTKNMVAWQPLPNPHKSDKR